MPRDFPVPTTVLFERLHKVLENNPWRSATHVWWLGSCFHLLEHVDIFGPFFNTLLNATLFEWTAKMLPNVQLLLCQRRYPGKRSYSKGTMALAAKVVWGTTLDNRFGSMFSPSHLFWKNTIFKPKSIVLSVSTNLWSLKTKHHSD